MTVRRGLPVVRHPSLPPLLLLLLSRGVRGATGRMVSLFGPPRPPRRGRPNVVARARRRLAWCAFLRAAETGGRDGEEWAPSRRERAAERERWEREQEYDWQAAAEEEEEEAKGGGGSTSISPSSAPSLGGSCLCSPPPPSVAPGGGPPPPWGGAVAGGRGGGGGASSSAAEVRADLALKDGRWDGAEERADLAPKDWSVDGGKNSSSDEESPESESSGLWCWRLRADDGLKRGAAVGGGGRGATRECEYVARS